MPSLIIENLDYTSAAVTPVTDPSNIYYNSAYDADDESDQEDPNSAYRAQKIKTRNAKTRRNRVTIKNPPHPKYPPYQTSSSFPHLDTSSEILDIRKDDDDDDDDIATTGPTVTPIQMMTERVNQKRQKQKEMAPEKLILHRPILTCSCSRCIQILKTVQTLSHLRDICSVSCDHDDSKIGWQQGVQKLFMS
ncbi:Protein of unknown function [Pyronema omphalodes CBS 100304]|uniref:Uncharacterized protein n=1 Tax=Pyronema omphalodes (strain CBS 100304) TaxID=1076935 RepID=U4L0N8_PYROM|nr:Protein of unknown function [Pyronema omphalodes CBS 100304]